MSSDPIKRNAIAKRYRDSHVEERKIWQKANYKKRKLLDPQKMRIAQRRSLLKVKFGITLEQYDLLLAKQDGKCIFCTKPTKDKRLLAVDHDHETGRIRGLLCYHHNTALSAFGDNKAGVLRLLAYVSPPKEEP